MNVKLVVESGAQRRTLRLRGPEAVIGRSRGVAVRIPSAEVSRKHCRLRLEKGVVTVEDLASVNGTYLNGEPVTEPQVVRPGDQLAVGPVTFVVQYELTAEARGRVEGEADYEILGDEEVPLLEVDGEEAPEPPLPVADEPIPVAEEEGEAPLFTFDGVAWQMPEGEELRDILTEMDDEDRPDKRPRRDQR